MASSGEHHAARRILLYGVTGSGKSTAALVIGRRTGLPVTLVDELTWLPGWVPVADERQRELVDEVTSGERWVLDSAYGAWRDLVLSRAELVIALDYPRWLSLARLARRTLRRLVTQEQVCNGNTESLGQALGPDSIIRWHFDSFTRKRDRIHRWASSPDGPPVLVMRRPRELDTWVEGLGR